MGASQSSDYGKAVIIAPPENEHESPIMVNSHMLTEGGGQFMATLRGIPDATTTAKLITQSTKMHADLPCVGEREVLKDGNFGKYHWINYQQFYDQCVNYSKGLVSLGLKPGDKIGIYGVNCTYWQTTAYASQMNSMVVVPVYDSLGPNAAHYIITHSECKAVVCHSAKLESLLSILNDLPNLKYVIAIDSVAPTLPTSSMQSFTCDEIVKKGQEAEDIELRAPEPSDEALIMYTSGSTGRPKGCLMTHSNLIAGASGFQCLNTSITSTDVYLSFLPLAHIYEMAVELIMLAQGASIGFFSGSTARLVSDLQALQPTVVCGVPRVWNRIADTMKKKISELKFPKNILVQNAIKLKAKQIREHKPHSLFLDNIVFNNFSSVLGGKVRLIVSGGAPILPDVYEFLSVAITPNILQGYGLTETAAGLAVQELPAWSPSDVGCCSPVSEIKLRAVEGLDYDPTTVPMTGELLVRGPHIFQGYYKDEEQTKSVMVDGKWFATGDIVMITENGVMQIVDRAKQLVKLSQGEYLSITTLNDNYGRTPGVSSIYIYADSHHDSPAAVVVPDKELLNKWAAQGITDPVNSTAARDDMLQRLKDEANKQGMRGFERVSAVVIDTEDFSVENGLLTPSQKPQWQSLRKKYECALLNALDGK